MKLMKLTKGSFHKFHTKRPLVQNPLFPKYCIDLHCIVFILSEKVLRLRIVFSPFFVNVESMEYCDMFLETAFTCEKFCMDF